MCAFAGTGPVDQVSSTRLAWTLLISHPLSQNTYSFCRTVSFPSELGHALRIYKSSLSLTAHQLPSIVFGKLSACAHVESASRAHPARIGVFMLCPSFAANSCGFHYGGGWAVTSGIILFA